MKSWFLRSGTRCAMWLAGVWAGFAVVAAPVELIPFGAAWRRLPGSAPASSPDPAAWRQAGFPDAGWESGPLPLFYGEALNGSLITGMQNNYTSYFLRGRFQVASVADVRSLVLEAACDDGFVMWINGREVVRYNMPDGPVTLSTTAASVAPEPVAMTSYALGGAEAALRVGENIVAVQVFNVNLGSSDLVFDARLAATLDSEPPLVERVTPEPGETLAELASVEVVFDEPVTGVEAGDLLVNGVGATGVQLISPGQYLFTFPAVAPGLVTVRFREGHGITDLSSTRQPLATPAAWTFTVDPKAVPTLRINEFVAQNEEGIRDEDGRRSDWIEIYNPTSSSLSLAGWSLTDDAANLRKWVFPALAIPGNGYVLVWASGNNRVNPAAPLHTNFRLSEGGEYLALVSPGGEVVTSFAPSYPAQRADVAYGRVPGLAENGYLPTPTPRAANEPGGPGFAPDVVSEPPSGVFVNPIAVRLSFSTNSGPAPAGAVIRYTLDGTLPTLSSPVWSGPLSLSNQAVQIRAQSFAPGLLPGRPSTHVHLPVVPTLGRFTSNVPVILIHNFNRGRPPSNVRIPSFFQVFEPGTNGITTLSNAPALAARAGISVRGSSTEGLEKASLRVEFWDEYGNDRARSFLGMPAEGDWVMYAPNFFEPVLIHNPFMHQLSRNIGRYSPRARMCEVFLVTSGTNTVQYTTYNGVYVVMERIEIDADRVDLGTLAPENLSGEALTGGYLMKIDRLDPGDSGMSAGGMTVGLVEPRESELREPARAAQWNYLRDYLNAFGNSLNSPSFADPVTGYRAYVDVPSWIDHHLLNTFAFNVDALRLSAYFGKRRGGKLEFGPLWDFDRALGSTDGRDANPNTWRSQVGDRGTDFFNFPWWGRMFQDLEFYQQYIDRYHELRRGEMSDARINALTDSLANEIRRAAARDWSRWGGSGRASSYQGEVDLMKNWMRSRLQFMDSQFVRFPSFTTLPGTVERGMQVSLSVPAGTTVYYTTDGSDPRARGGGVGAAARVYTSPFTISSNTRVRARAFNANHTALTGPNNPPLVSRWSGEAAGAFITDPMPLRMTEIHFAPTDGPDAGPEDFEFLEVWNAGASVLDLTGLAVEGGVSFVVAPTNAVRSLTPGARGVLVADRAAFARRYPGVTNVIGEFAGRLANEGEVLRVRGPLGEAVLEIAYSPAWADAALTAGHSLVPVREDVSPSQAALGASWRASALPGGSPGRVDGASLGLEAPMVAAIEGGEVVLSQAVPAGIAVEIQARASAVEGVWEPAARFPAGAARQEAVRFAPAAATRFFRAVSVSP